MVEEAAPRPVPVPRLLPAEPADLFLWDRPPVVVDTKVLVFDCLHVLRSGKPSFLLSSASLRVARLYATEQVRDEVKRILPVQAERYGFDTVRAEAVWRERYLSGDPLRSTRGRTDGSTSRESRGS